MNDILRSVVYPGLFWFLMGFGTASAQNVSEIVRVHGAKQVIGIGIGHQKFGWAPNFSYERSINAQWSIKATIGGYSKTIFTPLSVGQDRHVTTNLDLRYYPFPIAGRPMNGPFAGIQTAFHYNWGNENFERALSYMLIRIFASNRNPLSFRPEFFGICKALEEPQQMPKNVAEKSCAYRYTSY